MWNNVHLSKLVISVPGPLSKIADLDFLDDLDDVFVVELMILANLLRLVLDRGAPHEGVLHLFNDGSMHFVTEVLNLKGK